MCGHTSCASGRPRWRLLEATTESGPIGRYLARRGPGLHHLTLRVDDIRAALRAVAARGAKLIDTEPREGAEGALVAFIHPSSAHGVLVELKQERADSRELVPQNANEVRAAEQAPGTVGAGADPEPATGWRR